MPTPLQFIFVGSHFVCCPCPCRWTLFFRWIDLCFPFIPFGIIIRTYCLDEITAKKYIVCTTCYAILVPGRLQLTTVTARTGTAESDSVDPIK